MPGLLLYPKKCITDLYMLVYLYSHIMIYHHF